jgi:CheY-like chemotaxis protein
MGRMTDGRAITILLADDDDDDRLMTKAALEEARLHNDLRMVGDGVELLDYLNRRDKFAKREDSPRPGLILLDLNMPRMDGREALAVIKQDPELRSIPVIVLTTSTAEEDLVRTYDLGVNTYISKPVTFIGLVEVMRVVAKHWLEIVELPPVGD